MAFEKADPFVKWAGGKGQLLNEIWKNLPSGLGTRIRKYAEPFVGGGALLFSMLKRFDFDEVYISDTNSELVQTYTSIRDEVDDLIDILSGFQNDYQNLEVDERKAFYYSKREEFNSLKTTCSDPMRISALLIFLNRTCFNGLYRVNSKGGFNVPMGSYVNPKICDEAKLRADSAALQKVEVHWGDFSNAESFIDSTTFVYFDPPYRPLSVTSSFNSYAEGDFNDEEQKRLGAFIRLLSGKGASVLASNSDPKNTNPNDDFFDSLYSGFFISRVSAKRNINSKADSRGIISELLIRNYITGSQDAKPEF